MQKDVSLESGNIEQIDYTYNGNSIYNIAYDYYKDRSFASRVHSYDGTDHSEYYAFDKMKQLIYSGTSQSTAQDLHWEEDGYTDIQRQTTQYDDLGQKTQIQNITGLSMDVAYDVNGKVANPDQLSTNDPLMFKEQSITYNSLNRVETYILDDAELKFDYRPDTTKWRTRYYEDDQLQYTKYHFGNHEKIEYANGTTKNLFYIFGGKELTGIYTDTNGNGQMGYTITDHLGSIWALAYEDGTFIEKYAYDPWGRRVNPDDWSLVDNRNTFLTDRGFTLHEHYDQMQIINMVARLYDPLLGQFISVDPMADRYPGWGAYVYCMNNPLEYIDPTGELVCFFGDELDDAFLDLLYAVADELSLELIDMAGELILDYELLDPDITLSKDAQKLVDAIDNPDVTVNLFANSGMLNSEGGLLPGGSMMRTTLSEDEKSIKVQQEVNVSFLRNLENASRSDRGTGMMHEVTEGHRAGVESLKKGVSSPAAGLDGSVYKKAHRQATKQPGLPTRPVRTVERDASNNPTRVNYHYNNSLLMTYP